MNLKKYVLLWKNSLKLALSAELAYKANFFIRCVGMLIFGLFGPLLAILIYSNTSGIPGWTFWEFLLFQGIGVLIWGLGELFLFGFVWEIMESIRHGVFDRVLVRPFNSLLFLTFTSIDLDGAPKVLLGLFLIVLSLVKISGITAIGMAAFALMILLALTFMYAFAIFVASLAFLVTKSFGLFSLFVTAEEYTKFPLTVYGPVIGFIFTFVLPFGLATFYPAQAILGRLAWSTAGWMALSVLGFLGVALLVWRTAMKRYSSAGG